MRKAYREQEPFYALPLAHILLEAMPPMPEDIRDEVDYAHTRMRMLARFEGTAIPEDCEKALRLALRAREAGLSPRARAVRLRLSAQAALRIGKGVPLKQRQAYLRRCGLAAKCLARLIYNDKE